MKRRFDFIMSLCLLIVLSVPMLIVALLVKLTSRGPALYWSDRVGKNNVIFKMPKFRTMRIDAPVVATHLLSHPDAYVTPIGHFLRRSSLDELPQLVNVLRGEMSMVGPRPIVEEEVPKYGPAFSLYSQVSPGLTGLWQVSGRNDTSYRRRTDLDSKYIQEWTIRMDLLVLWKTVRVVLFGHGAY